MSITVTNNHLPVPRGARPVAGSRQDTTTVRDAAGARRPGMPEERIIEGEVVDKPGGGSTAYNDPFSRVRFGQAGDGENGPYGMLGIAAYLANSVESPAGGVSRYVDYYV